MRPFKRRKKLIKPRLQLLSALVILSTAGCYVMLQAILTNWTIANVVEAYPEAGQEVLPALASSMRMTLVATFLVLVPVSLMVGILMTFRVAGPVYRFECYLKQVIAGEDPGPCRIRSEDELHELCDLISEATAPVRAMNAEKSAAGTDAGTDEKPQAAEPQAPFGAATETPAESA